MSVTWDFSAIFVWGDSGGDLVGEDVKDEILGASQFEKSLSFGDYVDQNFRAVCAVFFNWSRIGWMFVWLIGPALANRLQF